MVRQGRRPMGIAIWALFSFIWGILSIFAVLVAFGVIAPFGGLVFAGLIALGAAALFGGAAAMGFIILIVGVLDLALGYGFWTLKSWAWTLGIALQVVSILEDIFSIVHDGDVAVQVISILVSIAVLEYLTRPYVRQAFGRA